MGASEYACVVLFCKKIQIQSPLLVPSSPGSEPLLTMALHPWMVMECSKKPCSAAISATFLASEVRKPSLRILAKYHHLHEMWMQSILNP